MRGPGYRLDYDIRRLWRCPRCNAERRVAGTVTTVRCLRCQGDVQLALVQERLDTFAPRLPPAPIPEPLVSTTDGMMDHGGRGGGGAKGGNRGPRPERPVKPPREPRPPRSDSGPRSDQTMLQDDSASARSADSSSSGREPQPNEPPAERRRERRRAEAGSEQPQQRPVDDAALNPADSAGSDRVPTRTELATTSSEAFAPPAAEHSADPAEPTESLVELAIRRASALQSSDASGPTAADTDPKSLAHGEAQPRFSEPTSAVTGSPTIASASPTDDSFDPPRAQPQSGTDQQTEPDDFAAGLDGLP